MSIRNRALGLGLAAALLATATAGAADGPRASAVRKVTRLLTGVYLTTYSSGSVTGASAESTVHLCGGGRSASALVGYRTDDGDTGSVTITASSRGVTIGGMPAEAGRSSAC